MLVNYIIITIRYFKQRWLEAIVNLVTATLAMSFLLIAIALYLHGMPVIPAIAFFICSTGLLFSIGTSVENRQYRNKNKELEIRFILGAEEADLYRQVFVESLLITSLGGFVAVVFLDSIMNIPPLTEKIIAREFLFHSTSLVAFLLFIPTLTLLLSIYPTLNLLKQRGRNRLNP